jgi:hypothetical protein
MLFAFAVFMAGSVSCASDAPSATEPSMASGAIVRASESDANAIVVSSVAELVAALAPENAGRRILVRAGSYNVTQLLSIPDGTSLEGEGEMVFDGSGRPSGFATGTRTTITMTANVPGDFVTLGNGASVRRMAFEEMAGRTGNVIGVNSRDEGDLLSARISEVEVMQPNAHAVVPSGPTGCGVTVLTQNPNLGAAPAAHSGADISATITRSLIHAPSAGIGCGVFAFNFAPLATVSVNMSDNVIGGGIIANGGVSRPDAVHDSKTVVQSRNNLYRDDSPAPCVSRHLGWNMAGGSGAPVPLQIAEISRNTLRVHSQGDRLEGFTTAIFAAGGRRFFPLPTAAPVNDNTVELELIGTTISTSSCGGAAFVTDFRLAGAFAGNPSLTPGDGNVLRAVLRGVTGSGTRSNTFADALSPAGPLDPAVQGTGNRLEIAGTVQSFAQTNQSIDPAPPAEVFTGGR